MTEESRIPTQVDEYLPVVQQMLVNVLGSVEKEELFSALLKNTGSLLAGGSVLACCYPIDEYNNINDLDIYVPNKQASVFLNNIYNDDIENKAVTDRMFYIATKFKIVQSSVYCNSFLRRNGVRKIYTFDNKSNTDLLDGQISIDVMLVRNKKTPIDVVTNFDLTFCQVWYDGEHVWATHPEHITNKEGVLQKEYTKLLILKKNKFLITRLRKYKRKGFKINFDFSDITKTVLDDVLTHPLAKCSILNTDYQSWLTRILKKYFLKNYDHISDSVRFKNIDEDKVEDINNFKDLVIVPLIKKNLKYSKFKILINVINEKYYNDSVKDDGYDTDDYNVKEKIIDFAYNNTTHDDLDSKELVFYRKTNHLLEYIVLPYIFDNNYNLGILTNRGLINPDTKEKILDYFVRKGTCMITQEDDVKIYDLHEHPLEGGISSEGLEGYLEGHIRDIDKNTVPCYYRPQPRIAGQAEPIENCKKMLTKKEVRMITSHEFYKRYTAPAAVKVGLDEVIPSYNSMLFNKKTEDDTFGMVYHDTMCPFCLQYERREDGCAYMTHANPKGLPSTEAPYCQPSFVVEEIRHKYMGALAVLSREDYITIKLEFCVECGRPCNSHQHFDLSGTNLIDNIAAPPGGFYAEEYGKCSGGGRPELYARVLAVRDVFRNNLTSDPVKERLLAAEQADAWAKDPLKIALGKAIFDIEVDDRKWGNGPLPSHKVYNNVNAPVGSENRVENENRNRNELINQLVNENQHNQHEIDNELQEMENEIENNQEGGKKKTSTNKFKKTRRNRK